MAVGPTGGAAAEGPPFFRGTMLGRGVGGGTPDTYHRNTPPPTRAGGLVASHPLPSCCLLSLLLPSLSSLLRPSCPSLLSVCLPLPSPLCPPCLSPSHAQRPTRTSTHPGPLGSVRGTPSPPGQKKRPGITPRPFRIIPASPPRTQQRRPSPAQSGDPLLHR